MSGTQIAIRGLRQLTKEAIDDDGNYPHMQINISFWERIYVCKYPISANYCNPNLRDLYLVHHE